MAEEKNETSPSAEGEKPVQEEQQKDSKEESKDDKKVVEENGEQEKPKENGEEKPSPEIKDMRAIVLNNFGGMKSMKSLRKPEPSVAEGEVLIRVKAW